jgi:hypothetical protein
MDTFGKINLSRFGGRQPSPLLFAGLCFICRVVPERQNGRMPSSPWHQGHGNQLAKHERFRSALSEDEMAAISSLKAPGSRMENPLSLAPRRN